MSIGAENKELKAALTERDQRVSVLEDENCQLKAENESMAELIEKQADAALDVSNANIAERDNLHAQINDLRDELELAKATIAELDEDNTDLSDDNAHLEVIKEEQSARMSNPAFKHAEAEGEAVAADIDGEPEDEPTTREQYEAITEPGAKHAFWRKHRKELAEVPSKDKE